MGQRDPRVDAYIDKAADFAKPILTQIRDAVHASCPDVEEAMKWSFPHFNWITEARNEDTRARRLRTAVEWMAEGKSRNWKYMKAVAAR
jgi:hypothetical protein